MPIPTDFGGTQMIQKHSQYEMNDKYCARAPAKPDFEAGHLKLADTFNFLFLKFFYIPVNKISADLPWKAVIKSVNLYNFENNQRQTKEETMCT